MKELLLKIASWIAEHYAAKCVYEAKTSGMCLCNFCENTSCPNHNLKKALEVCKVCE